MLQNINVVEIKKNWTENVIIMVELTFQASQDNLMHKFEPVLNEASLTG